MESWTIVFSGNKDEWKFSAYAIEDTVIKEGDRICQFRIMEIQPEITFEESENLDKESRGGFGSTGIKWAKKIPLENLGVFFIY